MNERQINVAFLIEIVKVSRLTCLCRKMRVFFQTGIILISVNKLNFGNTPMMTAITKQAYPAT